MTAKKDVTVITPESAELSPMAVISSAIASGASPETLGQLLTLQERHSENEARKAFDEAMAELRGQLRPIIKTRQGHNNKYEDIVDISSAVDPLLTDLGLSYRWSVADGEGGRVKVTCKVTHRDGHREETTMSAPPDGSGNKNAIQAVGSTTTYLQRYTLKAALGLSVTTDDDGRAAGGGVDPEEEAAPIVEMIDKAKREEMDGLNAKISAEAKKIKLSGKGFAVVKAAYAAKMKKVSDAG